MWVLSGHLKQRKAALNSMFTSKEGALPFSGMGHGEA